MPAFLAPLAMGLLSAGSQWFTNRANARMAREQMQFQENMSSTAAQRSVRDYRAAGLNPALAYERTASSPGGATAIMGDIASQGISSARDYSRLRQEMQLQRRAADDQHTLAITQKGLLDAQGQEATARTANILSQTAANMQAFKFNQEAQPHLLRSRAAEALLQELSIPEMRNTARWQETIGRGGPAMNTALTAAQILRMLRGGGR